MGKFEINEQHWPLLLVTLEDRMSDEDFEALFAGLERVFARQESFASLFDLRAVNHMANAKQRAMIAAWTNQVRPLSSKYVVAQSAVMLSAPVRGMMTALDWLRVPTATRRHFGTMIDACDWCIERLRERGVAISPALAAYRGRLDRHSA